MDLYLFTTDPCRVRRAMDVGIRAVVVDWEWRGSVEKLRETFANARLRCSFKRDIAGRELGVEVRRICQAWAALEYRSSAEIRRNQRVLARALNSRV